MSLAVLAIETATENCSVALQIGDDVLLRESISPRDHSRLLLPYVQELLAEADITLSSLDCIAVGQGPGSFTGVRIALSAAQGLAFGADLPVAAVSSLAALAKGVVLADTEATVLAAMDARMGQVYWSIYAVSATSCELLSPAVVLDPDAVTFASVIGAAPLLAAGSAWQSYGDELSQSAVAAELKITRSYADAFPGAAAVAALADSVEWLPPEGLEAQYLRNKVTY